MLHPRKAHTGSSSVARACGLLMTAHVSQHQSPNSLKVVVPETHFDCSHHKQSPRQDRYFPWSTANRHV